MAKLSSLEPDLGLLREFWGFDSLRPHQEAVVRAALSGQDTLALLPTGGGKSLCFQFPALQLPGVCMVISPLIALMQDQVDGLKRKGIRAFGLFGILTPDDLLRHMDNLRQGAYKLVYLSPERLTNPLIREHLATLPLSLLAVDEAHCISQWGHDFRPAYRNIHLIRELLPGVPVMALTATATAEVVEDIAQQLQLRNPVRVQQSFARSNLSIRVSENEDKQGELLYWLDKVQGTGIVYVGSRKRAERIAGYLLARGYAAEGFHGGMDTHTRRGILGRWLSGQTRIVVATSAFGMGIDKPDVRLVIHADLPDSLENYYQEAGRAGRDGEPAWCIVLKNSTSFAEQQNQYLDTLASFEQISEVYKRLTGFLQIPLSEGQDREFAFDFNAFCLRYRLSPLSVLDALRSLERHNLIEVDNQGSVRSTLRVIATRSAIRERIRIQQDLGPILEVLVRNYGGIYDADTEINEWALARMLEKTRSWLTDRLKQMEIQQLVRYQPVQGFWKIRWKHPREDHLSLLPIRGSVRKYLEGKKNRLKAIQEMLALSHNCRQQFIMAYFGQRIPPCGRCDLCESEGSQSYPDSEDQIIKLLNTRPMESKELARLSMLPQPILLHSLRRLLARGQIALHAGNKYILHQSTQANE